MDTALEESRSRVAARLTPTVIALIAFFTLVDLFAAQAILPLLAKRYGASPGQIGVAVNASTAGMAIGALLTAIFGSKLRRRTGIVASLLLLTLPSTLLAFAPSLAVFACLRVLQGLCMSCAFTLTLAHLGETCTAERQAGAFAAYITGNVASNLVGRLVSATTAGLFGTSAAFLVFASLNLLGAGLAAISIARSGGTRRTSSQPPALPLRAALRPRLLAGYGIGFLILFAFIGIFSYVNFVLMRPPLALGMMSLGLIYFVFAPSIIATPLAGAAAKRFGPRAGLLGGLAVAGLGLALLAIPRLVPVLLGMILVGLGTFFAQATATGETSRAAGAAVIGKVFEVRGWPACLVIVGAALAACAVLGLTFGGGRAEGSAMEAA